MHSLEVTLSSILFQVFFFSSFVSVCRASIVMAVKFAGCLSVNAGRNTRRKTNCVMFDESLDAALSGFPSWRSVPERTW